MTRADRCKRNKPPDRAKQTKRKEFSARSLGGRGRLKFPRRERRLADVQDFWWI